jgi:hypothetical protein
VTLVEFQTMLDDLVRAHEGKHAEIFSRLSDEFKKMISTIEALRFENEVCAKHHFSSPDERIKNLLEWASSKGYQLSRVKIGDVEFHAALTESKVVHRQEVDEVALIVEDIRRMRERWNQAGLKGHAEAASTILARIEYKDHTDRPVGVGG